MIHIFRDPRRAGVATPTASLSQATVAPWERAHRTLLVAVIAAIVLGLFSFPIASHLSGQTPGGLSDGSRSISFAIDGSGSSEAGVWIFLSDRTTVGLIGTLDWESEDRGGRGLTVVTSPSGWGPQ